MDWRGSELQSVVAIVDNDRGVRLSVSSLLRSAGLRTIEFSSGEEILTSKHLARISCLITDLNMPGMDGLTLREELLRRGFTWPVIIITAFPTTAARVEAHRLGVAAFLVKPVSPDDLLACTIHAVGSRSG